MDWKLLVSTFAMVFVAEIGDKTQLATLLLASSRPSKLAVFLGSALALVSTSALAVLGAELIGRFVSPQILRYVAGGLFLVLGVVTLLVPESNGD
ncbi:MAG: TMEM165/GDT1 family protein [Myxococcota bacterium]